MKLNLFGVEFLIQLLDKDYFDEKIFNKFVKLPQTKAFIRHEQELKRNTNKKRLKDELRKVITRDDYQDIYEFYLLKKNLSLFKDNVEYIKNNQCEVINNALDRVYKIVPLEIPINSNIYIIAGGCDGGFTIFMKKIYINMGKYIGNIEEFEKVLAHELYHGRSLKFYKKFFLLFKMSMFHEKAMFETLGRIFEEGIACLVQHGIVLSKDDPVGTLTKRNLVLSRESFHLLNKTLLTIKENRPDYKLIRLLNVYVLGYTIVRILYEEEIHQLED